MQLLADVPTAAQTVVVAARLPETPFTVISYAPVVVAAAVVAVRVDVCDDVVLNVREVGERLHVVGLDAPEGAVTAHVSVTVPVNELPGVTVMVEVLLEVAPGLTVMLPLLLRVKLPPPGACQKSPQPARKPATTGATASNNKRADLPIFISTPSIWASNLCLQGIA